MVTQNRKRMPSLKPNENRPVPGISTGFPVAREQWFAVVLAAAVFVSAVAVHWPVLSAKAVSINDGTYVTHNPLVLAPSWRSAGRFLGEVRKPSTVQGYYQPLTMISLMLDTAMGGGADNLRPYHRTSLLLHAANAALVVILLNMLLGKPWPAAFAGLLFALHPMTVETMAWAGERKTLLATCFALLCLITYIRYTRRPRATLFLASIALFLLALMSKPTSTPLPIVLLLLDWWPLRRLDGRALCEKVPFLALAGIFAIITVVSQQHLGIVSHRQVTALQHLMLVCHNLVFYPLKMLWPSPLSSVYPFPDPIGISSAMVALGLAGTGLMVAGATVSLRWTRALAISWLIFLSMLAPTLMNVDYAMGVAADKYAYLPATGFLILLAWTIGKLTRRARIWRGLTAALVLGLAISESIAARNYLETWRTTESLCRHILQIAPDTEWAHSQLAGELLDQNRVADAFQHADKALQIAPNSQNAHSAMGRVLLRQGRPDQAIAHFEQAIAVKPDLSEAYVNLAVCLAATNQLDRAIDCMQKALRLNSSLPEAHYNLAMMLSQHGQPDPAMTHLREAITLRPDYSEAHFLLGDILAQRGSGPQAIEHYRAALRSRPDEPAILTNLGIALARADKLPEAIEHLHRAVVLLPNDAGMHNNLGRALLQSGQVQEAITCFRKAIALDPDSADAHGNLARSYAQLQQIGDAIAELRQVLRITPASANTHFILANLLADQGQDQAAIQEYRAALATDPGHPKAQAGLQTLLDRQAAASRPR
jgi:protein O-mannosyl-transferase